MIAALSKNGEFKRIAAEPWFVAAQRVARSSEVACLHWELEFPEVFFDKTGRHPEAGFDAIVGNPPYDVLAEKELGRDLSAIKGFIEHEPVYKPSRRGKNNLYKLFICRALDLLADGGRFGFIVPMAQLGDDQAAELRKAMLEAGAFASVDAFPQKDDPSRRVFREAKLSTVVFTFHKTWLPDQRAQPFTARQHPAAELDPNAPSLQLRTDAIPLYDPSNRSIVSCSQADWDLAVRTIASGRMTRLGNFCEFFQGEVNETIQRRAGNLLDGDGKLVTRGASICLYAVREASQGNDIYLNVEGFLQDAGSESKAMHHRHARIVLQEASPQNNFRRIIAAPFKVGEFCNHTINYCPARKSSAPLEMLLAILDSKLAEWYFRLGSTNAHVSHYQLGNLPFPSFTDSRIAEDRRLGDRSLAAIGEADCEGAFEQLRPALREAPFSLAIQDAMVGTVRRIIAIEQARGEIARAARSALAPAAQPYQDLIDRILYAMAGLTPSEIAGLEDRLSRML